MQRTTLESSLFFYYEQDDVTFFASEEIILTAMNDELDVNSLQHFLSFQYVPEPSTLSKNIEKLLLDITSLKN